MPAPARAVVGVCSSCSLPQYEGTRKAIDDVNFKRYELAVRALKDVAIQNRGETFAPEAARSSPRL